MALQAHWPLVQPDRLRRLRRPAARAAGGGPPRSGTWPLCHSSRSGTSRVADTCPWALHSCWAAAGVQVAPLAPQVVFEAVTQDPFEQQPLQLEPPQLQAPACSSVPRRRRRRPRPSGRCRLLRRGGDESRLESSRRSDTRPGCRRRRRRCCRPGRWRRGRGGAAALPQASTWPRSPRSCRSNRSNRSGTRSAVQRRSRWRRRSVRRRKARRRRRPCRRRWRWASGTGRSSRSNRRGTSWRCRRRRRRCRPGRRRRLQQAPPFFHADVDTVVTQPPFWSQQPVGQEVASQAPLPVPPVPAPLPPLPAPPDPFPPPVALAPLHARRGGAFRTVGPAHAGGAAPGRSCRRSVRRRRCRSGGARSSA